MCKVRLEVPRMARLRVMERRGRRRRWGRRWVGGVGMLVVGW